MVHGTETPAVVHETETPASEQLWLGLCSSFVPATDFSWSVVILIPPCRRVLVCATEANAGNDVSNVDSREVAAVLLAFLFVSCALLQSCGACVKRILTPCLRKLFAKNAPTDVFGTKVTTFIFSSSGAFQFFPGLVKRADSRSKKLGRGCLRCWSLC